MTELRTITPLFYPMQLLQERFLNALPKKGIHLVGKILLAAEA